jgi:hypothetical protein
VTERFQVAGHALALRARLEQDAGARPRAEHGGEPLPTGRDAAVGDGPVVGLDGLPILALGQIQASDLDGDWPPGMRPVGRR